MQNRSQIMKEFPTSQNNDLNNSYLKDSRESNCGIKNWGCYLKIHICSSKLLKIPFLNLTNNV